MRRGVSGGQKKRVTTAEALLGAKQVLLLDEISTGLDSATTYQITRCLRNLTHLTNTTTLISLLQPAPETFELFDDVMLMSEGRIVYHGPREEVLGFFREMGFAPPARKGVADFLQEVSITGGEEKQRQRKTASFLSDGDASDGGGVVSAVSSPGGGEKQRQRKAVSFLSDGDASDSGVVSAGSGTRGGEAGGEEKQRQRKPVSFLSDGDASEGAAGMTASGGDIGQHGMVLPFDPLTLSFHNVNYYVDMPAELKDKAAPPGQRLQLLHNVSGVFRPGVLTALMGVSGAGKTTLMDVLAGRKTGGYIEGDIRVSGYPKVQETFLRVSGYCEQVDIHTPQVTVHESLLYSAWLRLPEEIGRDVILEFVEEVMGLVELEPEFVEEVEELVELDAVKGALVGTAGQDGLSVEQRKRLTIAVELVANPSIIFMDEPTSGLDARAAAIVMRAVRNTVNTGRTVVCTIHQPSIDIFEAFDEVGSQIWHVGMVLHSGHEIAQSCAPSTSRPSTSSRRLMR
ncbi:unnamed protein product [Closterium sp. Naga37s-1]|nr:unnamed protein product [Closterium sp. Naga37s-1]